MRSHVTKISENSRVGPRPALLRELPWLAEQRVGKLQLACCAVVSAHQTSCAGFQSAQVAHVRLCLLWLCVNDRRQSYADSQRDGDMLFGTRGECLITLLPLNCCHTA